MYMYVHICIFMYMYIACTYMFMPVRNFVNMYIMIHVCTMYRDVCTDLPILVQVVRIPDVGWQFELLGHHFTIIYYMMSIIISHYHDRHGR